MQRKIVYKVTRVVGCTWPKQNARLYFWFIYDKFGWILAGSLLTHARHWHDIVHVEGNIWDRATCIGKCVS